MLRAKTLPRDETIQKLNELRKQPKFIKMQKDSMAYLSALYRELEKRVKRFENRKKFVTIAEERQLRRKYGRTFVKELKNYGENADKIVELERRLKSFGVLKPGILDTTKDGFELNDAISYLACNSAIRLRNNTFSRNSRAADCNSIDDLNQLGLVMPIFSVGSEKDMLYLKDNVVRLDPDNEKVNNLSEVAMNRYKLDPSQIQIDAELMRALENKQKVLYFVASGDGVKTSYTGGSVSSGGHATLFIVLENGKLFSFGLSTAGGQSLLGYPTDGVVFLSSPDEVFIDSFPNKSRGDFASKIGIDDNEKMRIADMGQLRKGHLERIMHLIQTEAKDTYVKTYEDEETTGETSWIQPLMTVRNVLDRNKRIYDLAAVRQNSFNCAALLAWVFQERITCKNVAANVGFNIPSRCRRKNKSSYLKKGDIQDILDMFVSNASRKEFMDFTKVVYEDKYQYDLDALGNGIIKNPQKSNLKF